MQNQQQNQQQFMANPGMMPQSVNQMPVPGMMSQSAVNQSTSRSMSGNMMQNLNPSQITAPPPSMNTTPNMMPANINMTAALQNNMAGMANSIPTMAMNGGIPPNAQLSPEMIQQFMRQQMNSRPSLPSQVQQQVSSQPQQATNNTQFQPQQQIIQKLAQQQQIYQSHLSILSNLLQAYSNLTKAWQKREPKIDQMLRERNPLTRNFAFVF